MINVDNTPDLPPLREVVRAHNLRAEKSFGQNFLFDQNITDKIVRYAGELSGLNVIEIGPGPGGLTRSILKTSAEHVYAVEIDPRAAGAIRELQHSYPDRLSLIEGDALSLSPDNIAPAPRAIIANLPYNVATPLLISWLREIRQNPSTISSMTLMFQKEVADRLTAAAGSKAYGRLSIMAGWLCDVKKCFDIPPSAFVPAPKIVSTVVRFVPKLLNADAPRFEDMERLTQAAFSERRKMVRSSLKNYADKFAAAGIVETQRAEEVDINSYVRLAQQ